MAHSIKGMDISTYKASRRFSSMFQKCTMVSKLDCLFLLHDTFPNKSKQLIMQGSRAASRLRRFLRSSGKDSTFRQNLLVSSAVAAAAGSLMMLGVSGESEDLFKYIPEYNRTRSFIRTDHLQKTSLEAFPLASHFSSLRRHQTIQRLDKTKNLDTLQSKYKIKWNRPLGEGTFGAVYLGKNKVTGEQVAVKKIAKAYTDNISFQREIEALMHIRENGGHPNICGLQENYDEGDYYYLVLDLVSGGEMFDRLCSDGAFSEADAARLIREVASALAFMHGIGIVHGDMKPENRECVIVVCFMKVT